MWHSRSLRRSVVIAAGVLCACAVSLNTGTSRAEGAAPQDALERLTPSTGLRISVSNEYTARDNGTAARAQNVYPWLRARALLVEPHRATALALSGGGDDADDAAVTTRWTIVQLASTDSGGDDDEDAAGDDTAALDAALVLHGAAVEHVFVSLASYAVRACRGGADDDDDGAPASCARARLVCRYVRRELRSLSAADRDQVGRRALSVFFDTPTAVVFSTLRGRPV